MEVVPSGTQIGIKGIYSNVKKSNICHSSIRDPSSLVKPLKENATDEEKAAYEEKISANTSKANRILVLVRHGQYNLGGKTDEERFLTETGRQQADITGHRLALLYSKYLQKVDSNGNVSFCELQYKTSLQLQNFRR